MLIPNYKSNYPYLDLFPYNESEYEIIPSTNHIILNKSDSFPLIKRPFHNLWLPAPRNSKEILQRLYGKFEETCSYTDHWSPTSRENKIRCSLPCSLTSQIIPLVYRFPLSVDSLFLGNDTLPVNSTHELECLVRNRTVLDAKIVYLEL